MYGLKVKKYNRLELEAARTALKTFTDICETSCKTGKTCKRCEYHTFCDDCFNLMEYIENTLNGDNA